MTSKSVDELKDTSLVVYEFLRDFSPKAYQDGRYALKGACYVSIESYFTQYRSDRLFESHRKYIDVQYMILGREIITKCEAESLTCMGEYDNEHDICFYQNCVKGIDYVLEENDFLIIRPGEAHMPCVCVDAIQRVRKAVFKIPVLE